MAKPDDPCKDRWLTDDFCPHGVNGDGLAVPCPCPAKERYTEQSKGFFARIAEFFRGTDITMSPDEFSEVMLDHEFTHLNAL